MKLLLSSSLCREAAVMVDRWTAEGYALDAALLSSVRYVRRRCAVCRREIESEYVVEKPA